jgi:hypothetical protein
MIMDLCAPALIYVAFSLTQVIIDTFKGLYNTAFFKFIVMIIITILLNALCKSGMGIISWIIVFIPFIFMSVIVIILLYVFGLDPATGKLNLGGNNQKGGNLVYTSTTTTPITTQPMPITTTTPTTTTQTVPTGSTDPQYE